MIKKIIFILALVFITCLAHSMDEGINKPPSWMRMPDDLNLTNPEINAAAWYILDALQRGRSLADSYADILPANNNNNYPISNMPKLDPNELNGLWSLMLAYLVEGMPTSASSRDSRNGSLSNAEANVPEDFPAQERLDK